MTIRFSGTNQQQYNIFSLNDSFFNISKLTVLGKPKTTLTLNFTCESIFVPTSTRSFSNNYSLILNVAFRECNNIGELIISSIQCYPCPPGTYSYNSKNVLCINCPTGGDCSESGIFKILPGYWRNNLYDEDPNILSCFNNEANCVSGSGFGNGLCFKGHIGPRCEACDSKGVYWGRSYAIGSDYSCINCQDTHYSWLYILFGIGAYLCFFWLTLKEILKNLINLDSNNDLDQISSIKKSENDINSQKGRNQTFYLKIMISYFQVMAIVEDFKLFSVSFFNQMYLPVSSPITSSFYSLDCLLVFLFPNSKIPILHLRLIVGWFIPLICVLLAILLFVIVTIKSKLPFKINILPTILIFTFLYFQKELVKLSIQTLSCVKIGEHKYIKADVSFECDDDKYFFYSKAFGLPSVLLSGLLIPLFIFMQLQKKRFSLKDQMTKLKYGYLYNEYRIYYWEFIKIGEKILITLIFEYYDSYVIIKGMLAFIVVFFYFLILLHLQPYDSEGINFVEEMSSLTCLLSIFLCLFINENDYAYFTIPSYTILVFINILFICYVVALFGKILKEKVWYLFKSIKQRVVLKSSKSKSISYQEPKSSFVISRSVIVENNNEQSTIRRLRNDVDILEKLDQLEAIEVEENVKSFHDLNNRMAGNMQNKKL